MAKKNSGSRKKLAKKYVYRRLLLILLAIVIVFLIAKAVMNKIASSSDKDNTTDEPTTAIAENSNETDENSDDEDLTEVNSDGESTGEKDQSEVDSNEMDSSETNAPDESSSEDDSSAGDAIDESSSSDSEVTNLNVITLDSGVKIDVSNFLENSKTVGVTENEDGELIVDKPAALDVVCDKVRNLPKDYAPTDLVPITDFPTVLDNPEVNQIREVAYDSLVELVAACKEDTGIQLYGRSGYRSYNTQVGLFKSYVAAHGEAEASKFSARPGTSEHQTGLAIDLTSKNMNYQLDTNLIDFEEGKWLADHAYEYGFIIRFIEGEDDITGYMYEPWHIRYLGVEMATEVHDSGLTLEEYVFGDRIDE